MTAATTRPDGPGASRYLRVKICGITRPEDAVAAEAAGADAIGLVFAPASKRCVSPSVAEEICEAAGPLIARVGVFVNAELDEVRALVRRLRLTAVQLHGTESAEYARELAAEVGVVRALAFAPGVTPAGLTGYPADAVLLDAHSPGSGTAFAWEEAAKAWLAYPRLVLAGGLNAGNVARAVQTLRPYAVDVASGVEVSPGVKDPAAVDAFVRAARTAARS